MNTALNNNFLRNYIASIYGLVTIMISIAFCGSLNAQANNDPIPKEETKLPPLKVGSENRYLVTASGEPVFLNAGTAWRMAYQLDTNQVNYYFNKRKDQKFNSVGVVALMDMKEQGGSNVYGSEPFEKSSDADAYDPLAPLITSEYDFWDHLDYIIDKAEEMNFYVILLPTWGTKVAGDWSGEDTSEIIFNKENAYQYGRWIGNRYREKEHIIWMIGGDRSAVYGEKDYRTVFRAMAEGVADGVNGENNQNGSADYSTTLMSYHPRKLKPNSSHWFHHDAWLDFNSIQEWPEDQIPSVRNDYQLTLPKPTWLFEGRYEDYRDEWKSWQVRYQAYQTVFAGGHGHTYGHERLWGFFSGWESQMDDSGAWDMQHLYDLMTSLNNTQFLNRIPNQELIDGDHGTADRLTSNRIQATQGSDGSYAFIYSANGRNISVRMSLLAVPKINAYWYNPRNGKWHVNGKEYTSRTAFETGISSGPGAANKLFNPPGSLARENDWILVLR